MANSYQVPRKTASTATADTTAVAGSHLPVNATSGPKTITLPTGKSEGAHLSIEKVDSSSNAVVVTGNVRGVAGYSISLSLQYESLELIADSNGSWRPISNNLPPASLSALYSPLRDVAAVATASGALLIGKHNPVSAAGGNVTMTLPSSPTVGQEITVERQDASVVTTVTITGTIRGVAGTSIVMVGQYEGMSFQAKSDGSWWPGPGHKTKTWLDSTYAAANPKYAKWGSNFWVGDPQGARASSQWPGYLSNQLGMPARRMLLTFHVAYDSSNVLRLVQDGFNSTTHSAANYASCLSLFTNAGFTSYAVKLHHGALTSAQVASSQFWTDYTAIVTTLATRYQGVCPWFFVTNEFDQATNGTTYSTQLQQLITTVQGKGFKAAMSFQSISEAAHCGVLSSLDGIGVNTYPPVGNQGLATTPAHALAAFDRHGIGPYFTAIKNATPNRSCFITESGIYDKVPALETPSNYSYSGFADNAGAIQSIYWQAQLTYAAKWSSVIDGLFAWDQDSFSPYTYPAALATVQKYGAAL